jgi:hypothetical protein
MPSLEIVDQDTKLHLAKQVCSFLCSCACAQNLHLARVCSTPHRRARSFLETWMIQASKACPI